MSFQSASDSHDTLARPMSPTICLNANTIAYPTGGGHPWGYLNWALGLRANGCPVIWMEGAVPAGGAGPSQGAVGLFKSPLPPERFADSLVPISFPQHPVESG